MVSPRSDGELGHTRRGDAEHARAVGATALDGIGLDLQSFGDFIGIDFVGDGNGLFHIQILVIAQRSRAK